MVCAGILFFKTILLSIVIHIALALFLGIFQHKKKTHLYLLIIENG